MSILAVNIAVGVVSRTILDSIKKILPNILPIIGIVELISKRNTLFVRRSMTFRHLPNWQLLQGRFGIIPKWRLWSCDCRTNETSNTRTGPASGTSPARTSCVRMGSFTVCFVCCLQSAREFALRQTAQAKAMWGIMTTTVMINESVASICC